jgi:hypothetical protein
MKNAAEAFIEEGRASAPNRQMVEELAALKARNAVLEEDMKIKKARQEAEASTDDEFDEMSLIELRAYITEQTGQAPLGALNRNALRRMAKNSRPDKVA